MKALVDCDVGRKVPSFMILLGFKDVHVEVEADKIFTVIGRPHLIKIIGSEEDVDRFVTKFLSIYDDPTISSITTLHFTMGYKPPA